MNYFETILSYVFSNEFEISITMIGLAIVVYMFSYTVQQLRAGESKKEKSIEELIELYSDLLFLLRREDYINFSDVEKQIEVNSRLTKIFKLTDRNTILSYLKWEELSRKDFEKKVDSELMLLLKKNRNIINLSMNIDPIGTVSDWANKTGTLVFIKAGVFIGIQLLAIFLIGISFSRSYGEGFFETVVANFPLYYSLIILGSLIVFAQVRVENKEVLTRKYWIISAIIILGPIFFGNHQVWFDKSFMNKMAVAHFWILIVSPFWVKFFVERSKSENPV